MRWPEGIVFPEVTDDHIGRRAAAGICYEEDLLADMKARVRPGSLALDVGAHMGTHTVWLSAVCGCPVMAFEPMPALAEKLRANVAANAGEPVEIVEAAVSDQAGHGRVENTGTNSGMNQLFADPDGPALVVRLDGYRLPEVGLIKIDVEGHEMHVLAGAEETIKRCSPLLYIEGDREALDALLAPWGYRCFGKFAITPVYGYARVVG